MPPNKGQGGNTMYAVVRTGGKQYKVSPGDMIKVEKLDTPAGENLELTDVLLTVDDENAKVGKPNVEGASVSAKVIRHDKGPKIKVFKYKSKKNYRKTKGHRQEFSLLKIESITP